jgi:hypothetical protein
MSNFYIQKDALCYEIYVIYCVFVDMINLKRGTYRSSRARRTLGSIFRKHFKTNRSVSTKLRADLANLGKVRSEPRA